jgi:hypothetical protein
MQLANPIKVRRLAAAALLALPVLAFADGEQRPPAATPANAAASGQPGAPAAKSDPALGAKADSSLLARARGGTDTARDDMKLDGTVAGNSAVNVATGANTIDANSFSNMAGIPLVIQNSGANVLIQNATIINLQFK